jgi:hypothetical protein
MCKVMRGRAPGCCGLTPHGFQSKHNVAAGEASRWLKRQYIGRLVAPAVPCIEPFYRAVG